MAYTRKTRDEFDIQGDYGQGWETVTTEETRREARAQLRCYRENVPEYPHRIKTRRVRIARADSRGVVEVLDGPAYDRANPDADVAQCGACGRMWDDSVPTSSTPAPSGRCPFEWAGVPEAEAMARQIAGGATDGR